MNVLIADKFQARGIDELRAAGCVVTYEPTLEGDALRDAIVRTQCRVLVVRSTPVTKPLLEVSNALSVIVRAGAGTNSIDLATASHRSILVANCPGKDGAAVVELTFALILALDRRLVEGVNDLRNGVWNKKEYCRARGLKDRTLGIVGLGRIGKAVARRALAFEMNVAAWGRSLTYEEAGELGVARCQNPADVASRCDILSIHLPAASETRRIIDAEVLRRLKPGSFVINTARAEVLDYEALAVAIQERGLRVGLDVFPREPSTAQGEFSSAILKVDGIVYGTHHIGPSTDQARDAVARETVGIVKEYLRTGRVKNCVNLCAKSGAKYVLIVRHRNHPGVLAHTLNAISHAGINVEGMENVICEGRESGCAQIELDGPLNDDVLTQIKNESEHILAISHAPLTRP